MSVGALPGVMPVENSVTTPLVVIRPTRSAPGSVNHRPSEPFVIPLGPAASARPSLNSVMLPSGVMRPIRFAAGSTYQRLPSEPTAMSFGSPAVGTGYSVTSPAFVTLAMAPSLPAIATQRLPSGPVTMPRGFPVGKPAVNSVITAPGVIRPTALFESSVNQRLPSGPGAIPQSATPSVRPVPNSEVTGPPEPVASAVVAPAPRTAAQSESEIQFRARTQLVSGRAVRDLMQRSSADGGCPGKAGRPARAVLRSRVRVRDHAGDRADGRGSDLDRTRARHAGARRALVGLGGVRVADEPHRRGGRPRAALDARRHGGLPGRRAGHAGCLRGRRARVRDRLRGRPLAPHLHLRRGERRHRRGPGDPPAGAHGDPGARAPDRGGVPR